MTTKRDEEKGKDQSFEYEVVVIFVQPETSGNLGAIARTMRNFGSTELILVDPKCEIDQDAKIRAVHATDVLEDARIVSEIDDALDLVDFGVGTTSIESGDHNLIRLALRPWELSKELESVDGRIGIVLGRESSGLSREELRKCDLTVTIPTNPEYETMNVSHAAAIILYELYKKFDERPEEIREISGKEKEILNNNWVQLLDTLDMQRTKREVCSTIFKRLLGRSFISGREAHTLTGVFRELRKKSKGEHPYDDE